LAVEKIPLVINSFFKSNYSAKRMILLIVGSLLPLLMERAGERRSLTAQYFVLFPLTLPSPARRGDIVLRAE
jgi:hypothetical protein